MGLKRLFTLLVLLVLMYPALVQAHAAFSLSPVQRGWIERIEDNLAATHTVRAHFRQVAADGKVSTGTVVLARPGRMRFTYDPPSPLLLVANDGKIVFQDRSIDQITTLPLNRTPLGLLLRDTPRFSGDVTVTDFRQTKESIQLRLVRTDNPGEGTLTLFFTARPLALEGWDILDAQGRQTVLRLSDLQTDVHVADSLFMLPRSR